MKDVCVKIVVGVKGCVTGIVERAEHIGGIQANGETFANAESVAPIELVEAALACIVVGNTAHVFEGLLVGNVVSYGANARRR